MLRRLVLVSSVMLALVGCAAVPTPYQPLAKGQGYAEQKLESNRYRVSFVGNEDTPRSTAENYAMYRAAELTLFNGFDYFVVADQAGSPAPGKEGGLRPTVGIGFGFGSFGSHTGISVGVGSEVGGGSRSDPDRYLSQLDILVFKGQRPADNPQAFDAREVKANLEGQIQRPVTVAPKP
jgi:hypothetical protein